MEIIKQKALASSIHFFASLLVFSIFVYVLLTQWYPEPFFNASGGWQGLKLVILVDLVLGPLLTLIVYNRKKTTITKIIDFSFIISLQLSALIWGIYTVYHQRPIAIIFWSDQFYTVPVLALSSHYSKHPKYLELINKKEIPLIIAKKPTNRDELNEMMRIINDQGIAPHHQIDRYQPLAENFLSLNSFSININKIISSNQKVKEELTSILEKTETQLDDNFYLPLESKYQNIILVFNKAGERIGFVIVPAKNNK